MVAGSRGANTPSGVRRTVICSTTLAYGISLFRNTSEWFAIQSDAHRCSALRRSTMLKNAARCDGESAPSAHLMIRATVRSDRTVGIVGTSTTSAAAKMPSAISEKPGGQSRITTS